LRRTVLAPQVARFSAEWRPLGALAEFADQWRSLATRAADPNVFYEPAFALAAAAVFGSDAGAILVWSQRQPRNLVAFVPLRIERRRYGVPFPLLVGWTHPFGPLGVPLIDRNHVDEIVAVVIDHIAADRTLPRVMLLPLIPAAGPFAAALGHSLAERGGRIAEFDRHCRAMLVPIAGYAEGLDRLLGKKKRKELARQRRRLAEIGALRVDLATTPAGLTSALEAFFTLEAQGWKGRAGTAAAAHHDVRQFVEQVITGLVRDGKAGGACLLLDDRPIAAALTLRSGDTAWFWKIAYDESMARASPGVQLALDLTAAFVADPAIARVDSCATPDHPMIDHLWRERLMLADYLVGVDRQASRAFSAALCCERWRRKAVAAAKSARDRLRRG
jgi:CelD/BcsL family acetyltransferase involved in cellulose biosynthesis